MAWIESHQGLGRHIKTKRLARKLGISIPAVIGHLHLLWWWAMDNLPDGKLSDLEPEDVADEMMWTEDAQTLIQALIESGFIDETEHGLVIHDWHEYVGKLVEKRAKDAERKRRERSTPNPKPVPPPSNGQPVDDPRDGAGNSTVPYLTNTFTTTTDDDFGRISRIYGAIHGKYDIEPINYPLLTKLLADGISPDLIIQTMQERHAEKVSSGGKVHGFNYYEDAIRERHAALTRTVIPISRGGKNNEHRTSNQRGSGQFDGLSL